MNTDYLMIGGASILGVLILSYLAALVFSKGNPVVAFQVWIVWLKKYWSIGLVVAAGIFAALVAGASKKEIKEEVKKDAEVNKEADTIKEKLIEINGTAKAEIAVAQSKDEEKKKELAEIKAIPNVMERRKRLAELLGIMLVVGLFGACAQKTVSNYISAIPKPLDVSEFVGDAERSPEYAVPMPDGCGFEKIPLPAGTLIAEDGEKIQVPGGILVSDCKAEQLILYKSSAERFYVERNQTALVYQSLNQACTQVETMYQRRLTEETTPDLWEKIDCEACFIAGAGICIGIDYAIRQNSDH